VYLPKTLSKHKPRKRGGAVTFAFSDRDIIANTVGHLAAIPLLHLRVWTPDAIFKSPTKELAHELADRWKDVPFKGDVLVRVGHTSLAGDIQRSLATNGEMKNAFPRSLRMLTLPITLILSTAAKIGRLDHYNPLTQTVVAFHPHREIGMHEIGHAKDFDPRSNWGKIGRSLLRAIPGLGLVTEWTASKLALEQMKSDEERRQAIKTLEPAFSSYVTHDLARVGLKHVAWNGVKRLLETKTSRYNNDLLKLQKHTNILTTVLMNAVATIPGLITSRLPNRTSSFGYIFENTRHDEPITDGQVRYATATA